MRVIKQPTCHTFNSNLPTHLKVKIKTYIESDLLIILLTEKY